MRIPGRIKIFGHDVMVVKVKRFANTKGNYIGRANMLGDTIRLPERDKYRHRLSRDYRAATFLHEITHHVSDKLDLGLKEDTVNKIADGLYQVIKENRLKFY